MRNAVVLAGALALTVVVTAFAMDAQSDSDSRAQFIHRYADRTDVQRGATGAPIQCPSGASIISSFRQEGDEFHLLGTLKQIGPSGITVSGATGDVALTIAPDAHIEGQYRPGDAMEVSGNTTDTGFELTEAQPGCRGIAVANVLPAAPAVQAVEQAPSPTPTVAPTEVPTEAPPPVVPSTPRPTRVVNGDEDDGREDSGDDDREDEGRDDGREKPEKPEKRDKHDRGDDDDRGGDDD